MNKRELIEAVTSVLKDQGIKKTVRTAKQTFNVSDGDGNTKQFSVKGDTKKVIYTIEDVTNIVEMCLSIIKESIKNGESISVQGFGTLGLRYREPRRTKGFGIDGNVGEIIEIPGHYTPKFSPGSELKNCAKLYDLSLREKFPGEEVFLPKTTFHSEE